MQVSPPQPSTAPVKAHSKLFTEYYGSAVLFLIAMFLVVSFGFLRPMIEDIKQANAETESVLQSARQEQAYLASLEASINAAESIPPTVLSQVTEALPNEADKPSLLIQLDAAAAKNAVQIQSVSFSDTKAAPTAAGAKPNPTAGQVVPTDITLSLTAKNYLDVKRFLTDVEASLRLMDVIGISTTGASTEGQDFNFTVQVKTYTFVSPSSKPKM